MESLLVLEHYPLFTRSFCKYLHDYYRKKYDGKLENMTVYVAVATAAITFLKSGTKANAYIAAWRYLNAERICFELDPGYTEAKLADANKKGEDMIGKAD